MMQDVSIIDSLFPFWKRYKWSFLLYFFFHFLMAEFVSIIVIKYLWAKIINLLTIQSFSIQNHMWIIILYSALAQYRGISGILTQRARYRLYVDAPHHISVHYYEKLLKNSLSFFNDNMSGTLSAKIGRLVSNLKMLLEEVMQISTIFFIAIIGVMLFAYYNYALSVYLSLWIIVYCCSLSFFLKRIKQKSVEISNIDSEISGKFSDSFTNIVNAKTFARESFEKFYVRKDALQLKIKENERYWLDVWRRVVDYTLIAIVAFFSLYKTINMYLSGQIDIGTLIFIEGFFMNIVFWTRMLADRLTTLANHIGVVKNCLEILENAPTITDTPTARNIVLRDLPNIEFKHVSFKYPDSQTVIFDNFNLMVHGGQKVGLVGHTGAGKSSFFNLLMRFYDVDSGEILIGGYNIKNDFTQTSLRKNISYIQQEPILFHRTIRENIVYGDMRATNMQLVEACKSAYCYDFIQDLEHGFETIVGERGVKLSGGQKQRVAIARAFLKNSPILVLDEATSALDSITEDYIQRALANLMERKTVFVIAHRLSTLKYMDRIIVLQHGKIVEDGTRSDLLSIKNGIFNDMWKKQKDGMLLEE